jgi:hypothetical protein
LIVAGRTQLDRRDEPGAFAAIDDAADDDRARFEAQLDGRERPRAEPAHAHRARREWALPCEHLVAALGQARHGEAALDVGLDLERAADRVAANADVRADHRLAVIGDRAFDRDLARDDDANVVDRDRDHA